MGFSCAIARPAIMKKKSKNYTFSSTLIVVPDFHLNNLPYKNSANRNSLSVGAPGKAYDL